MEYYNIEPWGAEVDDMQAAYTRKIICDAAGAKTRGGGSIRVEDMTLFSKHKSEPQSPAQMKAILLGLVNTKRKGK